MDARDSGAPEGAPAGRPPYRNLRVWVASFDLALDILQMTRRLDGDAAPLLAQRLIGASSRMPVAVARGQSSGSATEFIRCLHDGLSDLSELETHLLMCAELGHLTAPQVSAYEARILQIRNMTRALIRRLRAPGRPEPAPGVPAQGGSALVMAILVTAVLGILGAALLRVSSLEMTISARGRDRDVVLNVAEAGAGLAKRWFDAPVSGDPSASATVRHALLGRYDLRDPGQFVRTRRLIDADGNPATLPVPADGTPGREYYRQGRYVSPGLPHLDLFQKPYRRSGVTMLAGTEDGPDIVLEDQPGSVDLLDEINADLFPDQRATGRIERIEIYAPPSAPAGSTAERLGVATVKVTSAGRSASGPVARGVVRMGLAEIPVNAPRGPLESCGDLTAMGPLRAWWGRVIAVGDIALADRLDRLDTFVASGFPYASYGRRISGTATGGDLARWLNDPDDSVEDPWLKVVAGGDLVGWATLPDQPLPYSQSRAIDLDHSNLFQRVPGIVCPSFDYDLWRSIALSAMPGDRHLHYFAFDPASGLFREGGTGPARSVRDWTHGRSGIFFFDTADGARPGPANLTPAVVISGGDWSTAGLIYLNATSFQVTSVRGVNRVLSPPAEPFDDVNHDLVPDPNETFVNLQYATAVGSATSADHMLKRAVATQSGRQESPDGEVYEMTTTLGRDGRGIPILAEVNLFGVLFNSGDIVAQGNAVVYGSLVAGRAVTHVTPGAATLIIYFDDRLNTGEWPPPEIEMPRTWVTFWQTSRP
ncbi:MAG TPA: four helix bundle protein [Candidatus Polarisedimenticolia bacterium]|jgi:four helix bundle protein